MRNSRSTTGRRVRTILAAMVVAVVSAPAVADAQYFGRNKVQYRSFAFETLKTDHFDIYYYPEEAQAAEIASRMAERWYSRFSRFFDHQLRSRQAVILYATGAHFRQTNAIEGLIGDGTGGVTEALKRRIVLPMAGSLADTDHVLGHELVHAFQFDMTGADPRDRDGSAPGILDFPLWFVEGMAEYLSLGPVDAQTSMWLRDAALREKLPAIKDLDNPKYFPYRWGHAFWAYIGARFGDRAVASLVRSAANPRFDLVGLCRQLGTDPETLTADWHNAILASANAAIENRDSLESAARKIISDEHGGGRYNIGPEVSPDGKLVAFFSEHDRFSIDLFLADAETGKIRRKLTSSATDPHFDSLEFLNSAGTWSPDGKMLAVTAIRGGKPVIALIDPADGNVDREIKLPGLDDAINPAFAPDGKSILFSGNQGGLVDLYLVTVGTGGVTQLTHDPFGDFQATFTPDGGAAIFVTERFSTDLATLEPGPLRLARIDLKTHEVMPIQGFLKGKHLSPEVSADGRTLTFIAEPDGISNLYRMPADGGPIQRVSSFPTGVAGITTSSPALSASRGSGRLVFSVFEDSGHTIYTLDQANVVGLVAPEATNSAALLPGRTASGPPGDVQRLLSDPSRGLPAEGTAVPGGTYKHGLTLDLIGQPTITAGASSFGAYVSGSVSAFFSDMLGDRMLGLGAQVGGTLADFGGQAIYVNRRHRWNWAGEVGQVPFRIGYLTATRDPDSRQVALSEVIQRQTSRGAFGATIFPFNPATRVELSAGARNLTFTSDTRTRIYSPDGSKLLDSTTAHTELADPMTLGQTSVALVHDTSFYGATSPIYGGRYRVEIEQTVGTLQYTAGLVDWRRYFMPVRPITIAIRGLQYGRYGRDAEHPQLIGLYAGYQELVHGYGVGSFASNECSGQTGGNCAIFDSLIGSRLFVANIEVRAPLVGLLRHTLDYGMLPVEVAAFADAGVTWTKDTLPTFLGGTRAPVRSYGGAMRINVFGLTILELAASRPLDRVARGWKWQLGIQQGF
jgi:Tol biopolymer transport system component